MKIRKLKIGITCYPTVGGSGAIATELGKKLAEIGHEVHFITSSLPFRLNRVDPNIFFHQVEINQYSVFQYPPYDIALASKMSEVIKRENLDVIHVHYAIPHAVCAILAKQMSGKNIPIVTTLHGTDITVLGSDASLTESIRFGIEQSDCVTAVSKSLIEQTYELITPNKHIDLVYNFIDERVYRHTDSNYLKGNFGILEDEKVVIHVSNFRPVKRVIDVVLAFNEIQKEVKSKLLLVGDGPLMAEVSNLVNKLNIREKVIFLGKQDNVEELFSISDLMLLLSEKESFGLVALEAMACGVPCIGTRVGGIPEIIYDGYNGYLCELGNIQEIAEKSLTILRDENLSNTFIQNAVDTALNNFTADKIVAHYEDIYYKLVDEGE